MFSERAKWFSFENQNSDLENAGLRDGYWSSINLFQIDYPDLVKIRNEIRLSGTHHVGTF